MQLAQKLIWMGIAYVLTIGTGILLGVIRRPYNASLFTAHKLLALASVVFTVLVFFSTAKLLRPEPAYLLIAVFAVALIAAFATGAFLSIGNTPYPLTRTIHIISQIAAICSAAATAYLLLRL